ncbi:MAG: hypothetical protein ACKOB8_02445 [Mycobacterium sp.]
MAELAVSPAADGASVIAAVTGAKRRVPPPPAEAPVGVCAPPPPTVVSADRPESRSGSDPDTGPDAGPAGRAPAPPGEELSAAGAAASVRAGRGPRRVADCAADFEAASDAASDAVSEAEPAGEDEDPGEPVVSAAATEGSHSATAPTPRATASDPTRPTYFAGPQLPSSVTVRDPDSIGRTRPITGVRRRENWPCLPMGDVLSNCGDWC